MSEETTCNSKELIAAAKAVQQAVKQPSDDDIMDCSKLCSDEQILALVDHVLATVRDDDDEPICWDWLKALTGYNREVSGSLVSVKVTEELSLVGDIEYPERWQVWFNEYEIGECVDRAGFRSLCRGLGVELKEPR